MDQNAANESPPHVPGPTGLAPDCPLALEEILRLVLQFADQASLVAVATVCHAWSRIALDERWKSLPSIFPLLMLVAPREWILDPVDHRQNLMSSLAKADWGRFRKYSSRVRSVGVGHAVKLDLPVDSAALVHMFHGQSPLLPNIKTVSWRFNQSKNCMSIVPFTGPQLENLFLEIDEGVDHAGQSLLLQSLTDRMPTLKFLRLMSLGVAHHISTSLASLISSLPKLTHLELPPFFHTHEIVAATAQLPSLTNFSYSDSMDPTKNYHESGMCFEFISGSFTQLEILCFGSLPNRMGEILQSTDHVGRLRAVLLNCPAYNSPQEIENVFATLASGARRLTQVHLACCPIPELAVSSSKDSLSIKNLRPLFACNQLRSFRLQAPHFTPLKDEDVVEMGKNWPAMCNLILCPAPLLNKDQGVGFDILPSFAQSFPSLRELRIFFGKEVPEFDGELYPPYQFTKLEILGFGRSPIPRHKARDVGFLIASLCQRPPSIQSGSNTNNTGGSFPVWSAYSEVESNMKLAFRIKNAVARRLDSAGSAAELGQGTL
ncbi:hypothetical protein FRC01_009222 [Tulasnella sp. 417]|nr:hypothetical protein FRC01_009222 [Tulasnella sp. 417]